MTNVNIYGTLVPIVVRLLEGYEIIKSKLLKTFDL